MAPEELVKALPEGYDPAHVVDHLKIHASPAGALGETFLVRYAAQWLALYRASMLDEFTSLELDPDDPCHLERGSFQTMLELNGADGSEERLEISSLDMDRLEAFLGIEPESDAMREAEERLSQPPSPAPAPPDPQPTPEGLDLRLMELLRQGQRVEAVTLCRRTLGVDMPEARAYVERLEAQLAEDHDDERAATEAAPVDDDEPEDDELSAPAEAGGPQLDPRLEGELIGYLRMGHRTEAVARYRAATGAGLVDGAEVVDQLAQREQITPKKSSSSWWVLFWVLIIIAVIIAYIRFGPVS